MTFMCHPKILTKFENPLFFWLNFWTWSTSVQYIYSFVTKSLPNLYLQCLQQFTGFADVPEMMKRGLRRVCRHVLSIWYVFLTVFLHFTNIYLHLDILCMQWPPPLPYK